jgi:hypothetical protein
MLDRILFIFFSADEEMQANILFWTKSIKIETENMIAELVLAYGTV